MYRFFYSEGCIVTDDTVTITGPDVNHMKNVLRMEAGEEIIICDGQGKDYYCIIESLSFDAVNAKIREILNSETELSAKIYLFQGLPKKDKMELIIQKAVELGVYEIIPVMTKRSIVKLEDRKKELKKIERWQSIAAAAAKQSGRGIIPRISEVMNYKQAMDYAAQLDYGIIPYENAEGIQRANEIIKEASTKQSIGVFIGPEGGFDDSEIAAAAANHIEQITLGKRILRTETAGLTVLSILMFEIEKEM